MKSLILVFCLLAFLSACGGDNHVSVNATLTFKEHTSKGVRVESASMISPDILPIIDRQLDELFAIATSPKYGYHAFGRHDEYWIKIMSRDPRCDEISFMVVSQVPVGTNYDGTDWDHDPRPGYVGVCAAGQFVANQWAIFTTEQSIRSTDIIRYEAEHRLLFEVDGPKYEATKIHTPTTGHPILFLDPTPTPSPQ